MTVTTDAALHERLMALAERRIAAGEVPGPAAADPVNLPMIRHWTDAMGDANPVYTDPEAAAASPHGGIVAPPAMIQVWTMPGVNRKAGQRPTPVDDVLAMLNDEGGYTGVVATNCEQTYHRYVRPGERLFPATRLTGLAGPKRTALGEGYFVTWNVTWYSGDEAVAEMLFRVLKFRPRKPKGPAGDGNAQDGAGREDTRDRAGENAQDGAGENGRDRTRGRAPYPLRPAINGDTAFFWEGVARGELRIQRCGSCGELRHPPGPMCPSCRSTDRGYVVASGEGEVFSYVVHHNPPVPGRRTPFVVAVVQLPEGVRIVGNVVDCAPSEVGIGMPLRVTYRQMDDELTLPLWAPREA
ncbi:bifunctional MaoC family dehydratase N-terminal/OB-fold nucleic acid binding domain-containing protein [Planobispora rosea]|uniref:bifunctional MaoC family dehydratase N-terminal/OB-fold nucleic acid binding domain-containing protein n=1 Tax=Planobispora rosea TaxID=35762 RepID=UPI00083B8C3C|nr:bifunctional MaoC family dehydratase N-terminal/OB-fold nucleic acid binding domain-containing protein [Planobispora rosea]